MSDRRLWVIRPLQHSDLEALRPVRLAALRDHPEAFGSSYEEELEGGPGSEISRLIAAPPGVSLGGFVSTDPLGSNPPGTGQSGGVNRVDTSPNDVCLVGTAGLTISQRVKQRHKGHISAVYVAPAWRGSGLARALLDQIITHARAAALSTLTLSVTVGNASARQLYIRAGFRPYGVEPRSLRVEGNLLDEELMVLLLD